MNSEIKGLLFLTLIFGIGAIIAQSMFVPFITLNHWRPDLVLVMVILISGKYGAIAGSSVGFVLGLLQDAVSPLPLGITALPKTIAGYIAGKTMPVKTDPAITYLLYTGLIFMHEVVYFFLIKFISNTEFIELFYSRIFPNTVYTIFMMVIIQMLGKRYFQNNGLH